MSQPGNTLLVCTSVHHQNTARIAHAMAEVLEAECVSPAECPYSRLAGVALLGIGSGIYYGRVHEELRQWARDLPDELARDLPVFIFTTSGLPIFATLWHAPLKRTLARKGCRVVGEFSCRGFDTWGPLWLTGGLNRKHPDARDLQRAREFGTTLGRRVAAGSSPRLP